MVKKILLFFILSVSVFCLEISDMRFDKEIELGKKVSKEFTLENNSEKDKVYRLGIEGDKNVKVKPNIINLKKFEKKKFKVEAIGKTKGNHQYYLIIKETKNLNKTNEEGVEILKNLRILQKYNVK